MSQKWKNLTRGVFTTGTNVGYVAVANYDWYNGSNTIWTTTSAYTTALSAPYASTGGGVTALVRGGLPYPSADDDGIQGRLVGCGLRVRNISQQFGIGGILYAIAVSGDEPLENYGLAALSSDPRVYTVPQAIGNGSDWQTLVWRPMDDIDLGWIGNDGDRGVNISASMIMWATPPPLTAATGFSNSQTFEFEFIEFWEFMGFDSSSGVHPPELSMSMADSVGLDRVLGAVQAPPRSLDARDWQKSMVTGIIDAIAHSDSVSKTIEDLMGAAGFPLSLVSQLAKPLMAFLAV